MDEPRNFSCRVDNVKSITDVLNCLSVEQNKDQPCHIEASADSILFIVAGRAKSTLARISLQADIFAEYVCSNRPVRFALNLTILLDCLHLFGASSETVTGVMSYSTEEALFKLSLEELGVVTTCDICSLYDDDFDELEQGLFAAFREDPEQCQIIMRSESLKEAIHELIEANWAGAVRFEVSAVPAFMKLSAGGVVGASEVAFPRSSDVFVSFRCMHPSCSVYQLRSLLLGMKALAVAKETYIRVNANGIMCIQHQIEMAGTRQEVFFDFLMAADEEEEEEGEEEGEAPGRRHEE